MLYNRAAIIQSLLNLSNASNSVDNTTDYNDDEEGVSTDYTALVEGCWGTMFTLILLGTVGNVLSMVTLCTKRLRPQATSTSLQALAVADLLVLWTSLFSYNIYYLWMDEQTYLRTLFLYEPYIDVYVEPFYWMGLGMSSFITLTLTLQRFIAIWFPFGSRNYCTHTVNIVALLIVSLIPVTMTIPHFFYYDVIHVEYPTGINTTLEVAVAVLTDYGARDKYRCAYHAYIIPFLWYIIPWICLAVLNTLLLLQVRHSAKVAQDGRGRSELSKRHSRNLTVLLIVLVLTYMVLNLPKCVVVLIQVVQQSTKELCEAGSGNSAEYPETALEAADWVVSTLNNANSAVNFILYCLFGQIFRREFQRLFCRCQRRVSPHTDQGSRKSRTANTQQSMGHSVM